jgi:hypothetical protein
MIDMSNSESQNKKGKGGRKPEITMVSITAIKNATGNLCFSRFPMVRSDTIIIANKLITMYVMVMILYSLQGMLS